MGLAGATLNVFSQNHVPRLLKHHARRWLMEGTLPPRKETRERVRMCARGGVCIVVSGSAQGRNRMRCPKKERAI